MIFKRRDPRTILQTVTEMLWPRRGWGRALQYIKHRLSRLPDQPGRIARGVFAGVFVSFSPLFGLHFVLAAGIARLIQGNILAALLATFIGNPLTFVLIAALSIRTGYFLLGRPPQVEVDQSIISLFIDSVTEIYHNLLAPLTGATADWSQFDAFLDVVFYPYLIGGLVMGGVFGLAAHRLSLPLIRAYQKRRKNQVMKKWQALREKTTTKATDDSHKKG